MATIINNPPSENSSGPIGIIILLVVLAVIGYVVFVFGLPAMRQMQTGTPQINVPDKIDINVNETK